MQYFAKVIQTITLDSLRAFIFPVDICHNYQNLTDAERRHDFVTTNARCDETLRGWYRFQGAAGKKMATTSPPVKRCDADFPAWLSGNHPTVAEGTKQRTVCIRTFGGDCKKTVFIKVRNCGSYYIYNLVSLTSQCNARYCGTD